MSVFPPTPAAPVRTLCWGNAWIGLALWAGATCAGSRAAAESAAAVGTEEILSTVRQKLHARVVASAAMLTPPVVPTDPKEPAATVSPPLVMKPVIVAEPKSIQAVAAALDRAEQERRAQKFSALEGGKIGTIAGFEVGGWWSPEGGWTFLRMNKTPTYRQADAMKGRIEELQELSRMGAKAKQ